MPNEQTQNRVYCREQHNSSSLRLCLQHSVGTNQTEVPNAQVSTTVALRGVSKGYCTLKGQYSKSDKILLNLF